jgi:putative zinc finger/helix-turn-helix YgiT family protein
MQCADCHATIRVRNDQTVAYDFGGLPDVSLCGLQIRVCGNGHRAYVIPRLDELHRTLTRALVGKPSRLVPCEIKFMRKHLGWSQAAFAKHMGVAAESASRWESGSVAMAPTAERLLRLMVLTLKPMTHYKFLDVFAKLSTRREPARLRATFVANSWRVSPR